jgi:parallel beta helix pectate lyase-like protein
MTAYNLICDDLVNANIDNGGGYDDDTFGDAWSDLTGTSGKYVSADDAWTGSKDGCTVTENGPQIRLGNADAFTNCKVGMLVNAVFSDAGLIDDRYYITAINTDWIDIALYDTAAGTADCKAGGFFPADDTGWQEALNDVNAGGSVKACTNVSTGTNHILADTVNVNVVTGTKASRITIEGVNESTGVRIGPTDVMPIITTTNALANGLIQLYNDKEFYDWHNLDFNGGGIGKAEYCINGYNNDWNWYTWNNCKFHDADNHGVYIYQNGSHWINCEFYANGLGGSGNGMYIRGGNTSIACCSFHDNANGDGLYINSAYSNIKENLCCNNGSYGIQCESSFLHNILTNNIIYGNTSGGIRLDKSCYNIEAYNNTVVSNTGVGWQLDGVTSQFEYFGYNHSYDNSAHYSEGADGTWDDFANGNNFSGDPLFAGFISGSALASTAGTKIITGGSGFASAMVGSSIYITSGTNFTAGLYKVAAYTSDSQLTLETDPTNGSNASAGIWHYCNNFTLGNGSPLLASGFPEYFAINGDIDALANYPHVGAMTREEPSGGGRIMRERYHNV